MDNRLVPRAKVRHLPGMSLLVFSAPIGVLLSTDLALEWPVLLVALGLAVALGEARFKISDLRERVVKLEARQDAFTAAQTASDNRLTRLETTIGHVQQTTDRIHALVQAMAAGLKAS